MDLDTVLITFCFLIGLPQFFLGLFGLGDSPEHWPLTLPWFLGGLMLILCGSFLEKDFKCFPYG